MTVLEAKTCMSENISHYSIMKDKLKTHQLDVANRG